MAGITEDIARLSQEIGPRPAGTEEEQQAALYIADEFRKTAGFNAVIEDFNCVSNPNLPKLILFGLIFVAVLVGLIVPVAGVVAFIIAAIAAVLLVLEVIEKPILSRYLRMGVSQNIVAKYQPAMPNGARSRRKVILVANYDSGKVDRMPKVGFIENNRFLMKRISLICAIAAPVLLLLKTLFVGADAGAGALVFNILIVLALIGTCEPIVRAIVDHFSAYNQAANNNASGVAVLLDVARQVGNGLVSAEELDARAEREGAQVYGEKAAREVGAVPEGTPVRYEAQRQLSPEESLAAAKRAIAALTGEPVADEVPTTDISSKLVAGDGFGYGEDSGSADVHFEAAAEPAPVAEPAEAESAEEPAAHEASAAPVAAAVGVAAGAAAAGAAAAETFIRETPEALQVGLTGMNTLVDSTPAWAVAAREKAYANRPDLASSRPNVHRSRYADAPAASIRPTDPVLTNPYLSLTGRQPMRYVQQAAPVEPAYAPAPEQAPAEPAEAAVEQPAVEAAEGQVAEAAVEAAPAPAPAPEPEVPMTELQMRLASLYREIEQVEAPTVSPEVKAAIDQMEPEPEPEPAPAPAPVAQAAAPAPAVEQPAPAPAPAPASAATAAPAAEADAHIAFSGPNPLLEPYRSADERAEVAEPEAVAEPVAEPAPAAEPVAEVAPEPEFVEEAAPAVEPEPVQPAQDFSYQPTVEIDAVDEAPQADYPAYEQVDEQPAFEEQGYDNYYDEFDPYEHYDELEVVEGVLVEDEEVPQRVRPFSRDRRSAEPAEFAEEAALTGEETTGVLEPVAVEAAALAAEEAEARADEELGAQVEAELLSDVEEQPEPAAELPAEEEPVDLDAPAEEEPAADEPIDLDAVEPEPVDLDAVEERYEEEYEDYDYYTSPSMHRRPRSGGRVDASPRRPGTWITRAQEGTRSVGEAFSRGTRSMSDALSRLRSKSLEKFEDAKASIGRSDEEDVFEGALGENPVTAEETFEGVDEEEIPTAAFDAVDVEDEEAYDDYDEARKAEVLETADYETYVAANELVDDEEPVAAEPADEEPAEEPIVEEESEVEDEAEPELEPEPQEEIASMVLPEPSTRQHPTMRSRVRLGRKPRAGAAPTTPAMADRTAAIAPIDVSAFAGEPLEPEPEPDENGRTDTAEFIAVDQREQPTPVFTGMRGGEPAERETTGDESTGRVPMVQIHQADEEAAEFYESQREILEEIHRSGQPATPIVGMEDIPAAPKINVADPTVYAESQRAARIIKLPDLDADAEVAPKEATRAAVQLDSLPNPEAPNPLLSNMIPRIDAADFAAEAEQPKAAPALNVPDINVEPEPVVEKPEPTPAKPAPAPAPAAAPNAEYYEVPKSRFGGLFGRRKNKKQAEPSVREWVDIDENWNAQDVGRERGSWESFRQEDDEPFINEEPPAPENFVPSEPKEGNFTEPDGSEGRFIDVNYSNTDFGGNGRPWSGGALSLKGLRERMPKIGRRGDDYYEDEEKAPARSSRRNRDAGEPEIAQLNREIEALNTFRHPDINTEVWFVALGAELSYNSGMRAFIEQHADELQGAIIVNVGALGAGQLTYISEEGEYVKKTPSSRMKRFLRGASERSGVSYDTGKLDGRKTTASVAMSKGYQAMSLLGLEYGVPALSGDADDVLENLDTDLLRENSDFIMALLKSI